MGILLDTGPLVALIDRDDDQHSIAKQLFSKCPTPFVTTEAVITEACYLANKGNSAGAQKIVDLGLRGFYQIAFALEGHQPVLLKLLEKYEDIPISLADACLICCAELQNEPRILTFDTDFEIYRWGRNKRFEIIQ